MILPRLQFAQRYPFSEQAKLVLREHNISLDALSEEVISRAGAMVLSAAKNKPYFLVLNSKEFLLQEILAYPLAKIFVSLQKDNLLCERFARMQGNSFQKYLDSEKNKQETATEIAKQLGVKFDFLGSQYFVSVSLPDFLGAKPGADSQKLVNQQVSKGIVYLTEQRFYAFLAELVSARIFDSLPVNIEGIPKRIEDLGKQLNQQLREREKKAFEFAISGKINPSLFPECMQSLYSDLLAGKNVPHLGRFYIAAFLNGIGMPKEQLISVFRKTPNFDERMTRYQIDRVVNQKLSAPGCEKVREAQLCMNSECRTKHPLSYYKRELRTKTRQEAKKNA
ncbi:MAG: hypothetical protein JW772_05440 [Candidatus Diapherotrites archaeon]|nr:hypothetical protein [Candidatus Diapherotrites archaeon]